MGASRWGEVSRCGSYGIRPATASGAWTFTRSEVEAAVSRRRRSSLWPVHPEDSLDHLFAASALALPSPSGSGHLGALLFAARALRSLRGSVRVLAPSLIAYAGEEQDLGCAAVARSRATGTVRRPEMDDVVHCAPVENRSILAMAPSVEGRRLTNGQNARRRVYPNGRRRAALQNSVYRPQTHKQ